MLKRFVAFIIMGMLLSSGDYPRQAQGIVDPQLSWRFKKTDDPNCARVDFDDSGWEVVRVGHKWRGYRDPAWFRTVVKIPDRLNGKPTRDEPVGMLISCGDAGEIYVEGDLQQRYDNDHPGMALLQERAIPGTNVHLAIRAFTSVEREQEASFNQAELVLVDRKRVQKRFKIYVDAGKTQGLLPRPFSGISQGGAMPDYSSETAARFKEIGIKWFRMDNVLTSSLKQAEDGSYIYDWEDLDKRVNFINEIGAEPILCLSYMPKVLDAVPNPDRHSAPRDYKAWEELVYQAVKRYKEKGKPIKYWEVWNEANSGWLVPGPGEEHLEAYLKLYDASARGVKRADPTAWVGGPCNASGPWDRSDERPYCINGEKFMRGLIKHCAETGMPLDFITWHEYWHPWWIFKEEIEQIRKYLDDYPAIKRQVKEFIITEWNFAWWPDWPHDWEIGAAWAANITVRAAIPYGIDKLCFFYGKDGDFNFRGSYGMLMGANKPKPAYNVCKLFSMMAKERIFYKGEDNELTGIASIDKESGRVTILLLNFPERYGVERKARLKVDNLPKSVRGGLLRRYVVDKTHSNIWHNRENGELEMVEEIRVPKSKSFEMDLNLPSNSVTLLEFTPGGEEAKLMIHYEAVLDRAVEIALSDINACKG